MNGRIEIEDWTADDVDVDGMRSIFDLCAVSMVVDMQRAGGLVWLVKNEQVDWRALAERLGHLGRRRAPTASA